MLSEPASSLTDLLLGVVVLLLALDLRRRPGVHRYWLLTFYWIAAAALSGAVHHGVVTYSDRWSGPSWARISGMVVLAVSYLLAATVVEVLGPGQGRIFWILRSVGLIAYAVLALTGHAGIEAILLCEGLTMAAVLGLWVLAIRRRNPLAWPVALALVASMIAATARAMPPSWTARVGLDPTSLYHVAQIPGMILLYRALTRRAA